MSDNEYEPISGQDDYMDLNEDEAEILPDESASNVRSRLSSRVSTSSTSSRSRARSSRSIKTRNTESSVWQFFNRNTEQHPGRPVCSNCNAVFETSSSTTTLRRHLDSHQIVTPKRKQKSIDDYRTDPHTTKDQKERDDAVITWIVCDQQPFTGIECPQWHQMISKFDPRYQFHNRQTTKEQIINLFNSKKTDVKNLIAEIPGKVSFTSDMWTASNSDAFLSLTIHYVDNNWEFKNFLLDIIPFSARHTGINIQ